jgi:hypothetical protein
MKILAMCFVLFALVACGDKKPQGTVHEVEAPAATPTPVVTPTVDATPVVEEQMSMDATPVPTM